MRQTINLTHIISPPVYRLQDAAWSYAQNGWRIFPLHGLNFGGFCTVTTNIVYYQDSIRAMLRMWMKQMPNFSNYRQLVETR